MDIVTNIKKIVTNIFMSRFFDLFWPRFTRNYIPIFMIHRIEDKERKITGDNIEKIEALLQKLKRCNYNFISVSELVYRIRNNKAVPAKSVAFTMDDGYLEQGTVAAPVFIKYNCPLTIFLITDFMDGVNWPWDSQLRYIFLNTPLKKLKFDYLGLKFNYDLLSYDNRYDALRNFRNYCKTLDEIELQELLKTVMKLAKVEIKNTPEQDYLHLSWSDARELESKGIEFAPHSMSHRILSNLSNASVKSEITRSWSRLQDELKYAKNIFCYPTGRFNFDFSEREIKLLEESGFLGAVSADHGYFDIKKSLNDKSSLFYIKRIAFPNSLEQSLWYCARLEIIREFFSIARHSKLVVRLLGLDCKNEYMRVGICFYIKFLNLLNRFGYFSKYKNIDLSRVKRIIFLCTGNVCRSAFAEWYAKGQTATRIVSYGVNALDGRKAHFLANYTADKQYNIDMQAHATQNISNHQFDEGDLIVGMEPEHLDAIKKFNMPEGVQFTLLGLWSDKSSPYIFDPYGMSADYFDKCFKVLTASIDNLLQEHHGKKA